MGSTRIVRFYRLSSFLCRFFALSISVLFSHFIFVSFVLSRLFLIFLALLVSLLVLYCFSLFFAHFYSISSFVIYRLSLEAQKPTPNPEIPKKRRVYANFFEKFARTFALFPVTRVRSPTEIVQMNLFR